MIEPGANAVMTRACRRRDDEAAVVAQRANAPITEGSDPAGNRLPAE
ncbi:hypothetical protein [Catellatospora methionotrophica]